MKKLVIFCLTVELILIFTQICCMVFRVIYQTVDKVVLSQISSEKEENRDGLKQSPRFHVVRSPGAQIRPEAVAPPADDSCK